MYRQESSSLVHRKRCGQALAENSAFLVVFIAVFIGLLMLLLYTGAALYYQQKVSYAAFRGAMAEIDYYYWLGAPRPSGTGTLQTGITDAVNATLTGMGMPAASQVQVSSQFVNTPVNDYAGTYVVYTVTVTINNFRLPFGPVLPTLTDTVSFVADTQAPPAIAGVSLGPSGQNYSFYVPSYGPGDLNNNPITYSVGISGVNGGGNASQAPWAYYQGDAVIGWGPSANPNTPQYGWVSGPAFTGWNY